MTIRLLEDDGRIGRPAGEAVPRVAGIYRGWFVVAACVILLCVGTGPIFYCYGIFTVPFVQTFGSSRTLITLGLTLTLLIGGLASFPIGWLADRYRLKPMILIGIAGTALGLALVSIAGAMWQIVLLYGTLIATADVLMGMLPINLLLARWFGRRRGLAFGIAAMGASVGAILFPPLAAFLVQAAGWRATFLILAGIALLVMLPIAMFGDFPGRGLPAPERLPDTAPLSGQTRLGAIVRGREFCVLTAAVGLLGAANTGFALAIVPFATGQGAKPVDAAALVSVLGSAALCGKLVVGAIADRIDLRWALRAAIALCFVSTGLLGAFRGGYALWMASAAFMGLSMGGQLPLWGAIAARLYGMAIYGRVLGLSRAAMLPINFLLPLLAGAVFDQTRSYDWVWRLYAGAAALVLAFTMLMRPIPRLPRSTAGTPRSAAGTPRSAAGFRPGTTGATADG